MYRWPEAGWKRGWVARLAKQALFSHVVHYRRPIAAFTGDVDTLLDPASYNIRRVLLVPA